MGLIDVNLLLINFCLTISQPTKIFFSFVMVFKKQYICGKFQALVNTWNGSRKVN